jgi:hypothetical protein
MKLLVIETTPSSPLLIEIEIKGTWWPQRKSEGGKSLVKLSQLRLLLLCQVEFVHLLMLKLVNK